MTNGHPCHQTSVVMGPGLMPEDFTNSARRLGGSGSMIHTLRRSHATWPVQRQSPYPVICLELPCVRRGNTAEIVQ